MMALYRCIKCGNGWDYKRKNSTLATTRVQCPRCKSTRIERESDGTKVNKKFTGNIQSKPEESADVGENDTKEETEDEEKDIDEEIEEMGNVDAFETLDNLQIEFDDVEDIQADEIEEEKGIVKGIKEKAEKNKDISSMFKGTMAIMIIKLSTMIARKTNNKVWIYSKDEAETTENAILKGMDAAGLKLGGSNMKWLAFLICLGAAMMILLSRFFTPPIPFKQGE